MSNNPLVKDLDNTESDENDSEIKFDTKKFDLLKVHLSEVKNSINQFRAMYQLYHEQAGSKVEHAKEKSGVDPIEASECRQLKKAKTENESNSSGEEASPLVAPVGPVTEDQMFTSYVNKSDFDIADITASRKRLIDEYDEILQSILDIEAKYIPSQECTGLDAKESNSSGENALPLVAPQESKSSGEDASPLF